MIKAIETHYNGYRFRSRLEARWAVFFDTLGVPWEYEKEGYDLGNAGWYLPDFWLPHLHSWAEIKGDKNTIDLHKAIQCAQKTNRPVFLLSGNVGDQTGLYILPEIPALENSIEAALLVGAGVIDNDDLFTCIEDCQWAICPRCDRLSISWIRDDENQLAIGCFYCYTDHVKVNAKIKRYDPRKARDLLSAYEAARSARFEHGETPKVKRGRQNS